jgi:DMSO/TMAO reductase YedYZ molybdopterin-dependent catalytic subunit
VVNKLLMTIATFALAAVAYAAPTRIVPTEPTWWIAFSADTTIVHHGYVEPPNRVVTGQPNVETYPDSVAWAERVVELGGEVAEELPTDNDN